MQKEFAKKRTFNCRSCGGALTMYANDSMVKCTYCGNICEVSGGRTISRGGKGKGLLLSIPVLLISAGIGAYIMYSSPAQEDTAPGEQVIITNAPVEEGYTIDTVTAEINDGSSEEPLEQNTSSEESRSESNTNKGTNNNSKKPVSGRPGGPGK